MVDVPGPELNPTLRYPQNQGVVQAQEADPKGVRPYGTWPSPVSADDIAAIPLFPFSCLHADDHAARWVEGRPDEGGRGVVVEFRRGHVHDVTPAGFDARSRVHEYGGGAAWFHGETVLFSDFATGRLHRQDGAKANPKPITPSPTVDEASRYADGSVTRGGRLTFCVRERHTPCEVHNEIVVVPTDGSEPPRVVAAGHDFYAAPRVSPDGRKLAWLTWDHPQMPWDGTDLWVADISGDGSLMHVSHVAGSSSESVIDPQWSPDGRLHYLADGGGWWNLHREDGPLTVLSDGEIGNPPWVLGESRYAFLDGGRVACVVTRGAADSLEILMPESRELQPAGLQWTAYEPTCLSAHRDQLVFAARSPLRPMTIVAWDAQTGAEQHLHAIPVGASGPLAIPLPQPIAFPTGDGATAHAFYYPPASGEYDGPHDERPPVRVVCHGGPTSHTSPGFQHRHIYWTSRGIGVLDVNYRGSSGYGRDYRRLLQGRWGEIDWRDCVAAARFLVERGEADPRRTWIEGVSAGGYVALCSLAFDPTAFAAGVSYFGVSDAEKLAIDTHKFESHYFDTMIGPYPECAELYRARSPLYSVNTIERPLLILQGLDDRVVPPQQAAQMAGALDQRGIPHAYIRFAGEGHGFRRQESVRRAIASTLAFVADIFSFQPADPLEFLEINHRDQL